MKFYGLRKLYPIKVYLRTLVLLFKGNIDYINICENNVEQICNVDGNEMSYNCEKVLVKKFGWNKFVF
jgi:hypothetical protein